MTAVVQGATRIQPPIAIISDLHSNLEALEVVLADIDARRIENIICLGDIVGYGPNPRQCLDLVIDRCKWALMGNHDYAAMYEPTNFNAGAEAAAFWTRHQLESEPDPALRQRRWEFLGAMESRKTLGEGLLCVHGSPRRPINEYIFADDVTTAPAKMTSLFERVERCCFVGHTHVQGIFTDEPDFYGPGELGPAYVFNDYEKVIINVGSVGQPRDRDPRAGYAVLYGDRVEFYRLEYDVRAVVAKIEAIDELNDFFGQRLLEGR
jgi:diadenosine tetraphosphatase ApaH/serine/threonine PP2A family protein phosphatase